MENDSREFSDLTLSRAECPKCGAVWMNGQHTWATGAKGSEEDLAGLVCNTLGNYQCINPKKGCLLYTSPSPRDKRQSRMPSSA